MGTRTMTEFNIQGNGEPGTGKAETDNVPVGLRNCFRTECRAVGLRIHRARNGPGGHENTAGAAGDHFFGAAGAGS